MIERISAAAPAIKNLMLPAGPTLRRLPCGIGRGVRLEIDFRHHTKLFLGLYEVELNRIIRALCLPGTSCFDVGAQSGYDALVFAKLAGARVRSFECDAAAAEDIRRTFANNLGLRGQLDMIEATVAAQTAAARQELSLDEAAYGPNGFVPDLVKIDVDGAELQALLGATRLLHERHPHLIVETHSLELEIGCIEVLRSAGYQPTIVNQRAWLRDHRPIAHNRWLVARGTPA